MTRSTDTASGSSGRRSLAELFAGGIAASLRNEGRHEEADAVSVERVAAQLGEHAHVRPAEPKRSPEATRAVKRAHASKLAAAAEPVTPAELPRERPPRRAWQPVKPWSSQRSRARFLAKASKAAPRFAPRDWMDRTWSGVRVAFTDTGGQSARRLVCELPRELRRRCEAAILLAQHARGDRARGVDWTHVTARGIACCALVLYRESIGTRKRGFARVLVGVTQWMFAGLFRNPQGGRFEAARASASKRHARDGKGAPHYHRNTLFATEIHGDKTRGGWMTCLERVGFFWSVQPDADAVPAAHVGPSGFALNQYWITERAALAPPDAPDLARLAAAGLDVPELDASSVERVEPPPD